MKNHTTSDDPPRAKDDEFIGGIEEDEVFNPYLPDYQRGRNESEKEYAKRTRTASRDATGRLLKDREFHEFRQKVGRFHVEFLLLAISAGLAAPSRAFPPVDSILDDDGFIIAGDFHPCYEFIADIRKDPRTIEEELDAFKEYVMGKVRAARESISASVGGFSAHILPAHFRDTAGRRRPEVKKTFQAWETALQVYQLYHGKAGEKKANVAKEMGWYPVLKNDPIGRTKASERVSQYLSLTDRLMKAAIEGRFHLEMSATLPKNI